MWALSRSRNRGSEQMSMSDLDSSDDELSVLDDHPEVLRQVQSALIRRHNEARAIRLPQDARESSGVDESTEMSETLLRNLARLQIARRAEMEISWDPEMVSLYSWIVMILGLFRFK